MWATGNMVKFVVPCKLGELRRRILWSVIRDHYLGNSMSSKYGFNVINNSSGGS